VGIIRSVARRVETSGAVSGSPRCRARMPGGKPVPLGSGSRAAVRPGAAALLVGLCLLLLTAVSAAACGGSTSQQADLASKVTPTVSPREAAKSYFAAMAPVIEKDVKVGKQFSAAMDQWARQYKNSSPTGWAPWQSLVRVLQRFKPQEQEILSSYEAVDVPSAFRRAHAALLTDNRTSVAYAEALIHDVLTQRPPQQWFVKMMNEMKRGLTLDKRVVREFRKAAGKLDLRMPAKLLKLYSK
jgi:hypothetical protein